MLYCEKMTRPVRGGLHNQSAFSLSLVLDYALATKNGDLEDAVRAAARRFFWDDVDVDLRYEPSAVDFLSPALAEAELMGLTLGCEAFEAWFDRFAPEGFDLLRPVEVVDPSNGQLAHWAGLNLSRSWMLTVVARCLPSDHRFAFALRENARAHYEVGLPMAAHPDYMISHWVPTFAMYVVTMV